MMQAKEIIEVDIIAYGMEGEGIAKSDIFTIFIPYAMIGERIRAQIEYVKKNLVFAKIIKVLVPSSERKEYQCPYYGKCGGCNMQHLPREQELKIKTDNVLRCLHQIANVDVKLSDTVFSEKRLGYRNKVALPIRNVNGKICVGMYRNSTHKLIPITRCLLNDGFEESLIQGFCEYAAKHNLSAYDELTGKGLFRHIVARKLENTVSIVLVINGAKIPFKNDLIAIYSEIFESFTLAYSTNTLRNNVILGDSIVNVYGETNTITHINGLSYSIHPLSFMQVNDAVRDLAYNEIVSLIPENSVVIDAFSGTGIMSTQIAKKAKFVYGIEIVSEAVQNANQNAEMNGFCNKIHNILGDCTQELPPLISRLSSQNEDQITLVLDPPRQGVSKEALLSISPEIKQILYLSCNPATLARDLSILLSLNYTLQSIKCFDMFPSTPHIETLVSLCRK